MFLGQKDNALYVGKTNDLKARFRAHKEEKIDMWNEHTHILINEFDNENDQSAYEKLMIMKHSSKYNVTDNHHSTIEIIDTRADNWELFDELILKDDYIFANNTSIKVSKRKTNTSGKFYDTLWIRKEDGFIKISGNGTVKLDKNEFEKLIDEMQILSRNEIHVTSKCSGLKALEKLKQKRIT